MARGRREPTKKKILSSNKANIVNLCWTNRIYVNSLRCHFFLKVSIRFALKWERKNFTSELKRKLCKHSIKVGAESRKNRTLNSNTEKIELFHDFLDFVPKTLLCVFFMFAVAVRWLYDSIACWTQNNRWQIEFRNWLAHLNNQNFGNHNHSHHSSLRSDSVASVRNERWHNISACVQRHVCERFVVFT